MQGPQKPQIRLQVRLVIVSLIFGSGTIYSQRPSWSSTVIGPLSWLGLVCDFSPSCPRLFLPDFLILSCYYSGVCFCFFLLFHSYYSHARGILSGLHTSCMGSPFLIAIGVLYIEAKWLNGRSVVIDCPLSRFKKKYKLT